MNLVLVESPTKARTLTRFLGDGYAVEATYGHIRDLPERKLGIDMDKNFLPEYVVTEKQGKRLEEIKRLSEKADEIYLATDPDREGEAIAFHVAELLKGSNDQFSISNDQINSKSQIPKFKRIVFHEITEQAIREALAHPRGIDMQLVDAQQARRVLDRLVGYKLSPLLWKKIRRGLSAGRVQSVAVRLIVEREREIEAFKPEEYWNIVVEVNKVQDSGEASASRAKFKIQLIDKISNQEQAEKTEHDLRGARYVVEKVEKKEFRRTPPPPFTTSTMQQAGANRLGWSAKKTMQVAQSLYEEGYITYHRTDSTNIADEAVNQVNRLISDRFGKNYALEKPRFYKTKSKVAQEAHEAIRPTEVEKERLENVNRDQEKLYEMIWKRYVACQMAEARGESVKITVEAQLIGFERYGLEAKGETISFDGWYKMERESGRVEEQEKLPEVSQGGKLQFVDIIKEQKFTEAKARYNDASLIKTLEEMGIGRPSTYAPTISTIQDRQYVEKIDLPAGRQGKRFKPTALGIAVNDFLVANFDNIVDYEFTANMEYGLDEVANGEKKWQPLISDFYGPFAKQLADVTQTAARVKVEVEKTGEKCPDCYEGDVVIRIGKFGRFLACSRYPECKYIGNFQNKIGIKCPKCGHLPAGRQGDVIIRRTKTGRSFYGCSNYPKCDFASWSKPK